MDVEIDEDNYVLNIKHDVEMVENLEKIIDHIEPIELIDTYAPNICKLDFV